MRPPLAFALALLACLCTACQASKIDAEADAKTADAYSAAAHGIDHATCADGSTIGPDCGLILKLAATDAFRAKFRAKVCADKDAAACDAAYRRFIDAELQRRYFAADWGAVTQQCDLHPGRCDDGVTYERMLLDSHNERVQEKYASDRERIEAERRSRHAEDVAKTLHAADEVVGTVAALSGAQVCHSYPSVFGGEVTICDR